jgi:flagellar biosynthesis protein FliP
MASSNAISYHTFMDAFTSSLGGLAAVVLLTSFVKIFTSLHILRAGIGIRGAGFGVVIAAVSFALSLVVMGPQLQASGGLEGLLSGNPKSTERLEERFRPFLERTTDTEIRGKLSALAVKLQAGAGKPAEKTVQAEAPAPAPQQEPFSVLIASFLISELQAAFTLGLMFLVPFIVIDVLVANALMALGMMQISAAVVALPLKLLLFVVVDGWTLVAEKLLAGYAG